MAYWSPSSTRSRFPFVMRTWKNYSWPNTLPKDQKFTHCDFEYLVLSRVEARHFAVNPDHRASIKVKWSSGHSVSGWFRRESAVSRPERPMEDGERRSHTPKKANLQICELQWASKHGQTLLWTVLMDRQALFLLAELLGKPLWVGCFCFCLFLKNFMQSLHRDFTWELWTVDTPSNQ